MLGTMGLPSPTFADSSLIDVARGVPRGADRSGR